ncbi:MAG: hypothetical protein QNL04_14435 [SAR324 cluster bacterium]|nr:hypothetical protein [SAR324 cluster bacterium]
MKFKITIASLLYKNGKSLEASIFDAKGYEDFTYESLADFLMQAPPEDRRLIENTLKRIDSENGDVFRYLKFLAEEMLDCLGFQRPKTTQQKVKRGKVLYFPIQELKTQKA